MKIFHALLIVLLLPLLAYAGQPAWFLLSRDDGCIDLQLLVKHERLPRMPDSPEEYARMMRERGEDVVIGTPPGFPAELAGKVVQVTVSPSKAPIFVTGEICRTLDK